MKSLNIKIVIILAFMNAGLMVMGVYGFYVGQKALKIVEVGEATLQAHEINRGLLLDITLSGLRNLTYLSTCMFVVGIIHIVSLICYASFVIRSRDMGTNHNMGT